jgi:UDP-glucose 4,6-dehydratase
MYYPNNILITGGCGFIASNFINHLLEKYDNLNIYNLDILNYCSNENNVNPHKNYKFIKGDICSRDLVSFILNEYQIDTIIHFAAQSHVDNSFGKSLDFTRDNVLGTHNLLECSRIYKKIKRFIHVSTDEVYGEVEMNETCNEKSLLNPTNPYAASKAAAEFIVKSYSYSFKLPIIITRGNNVYGPRQYPEKLIPKFIKQLHNNEKCTIHGQGLSRRNFLHVFDVSNAFEKILFKGKLNEIYNIGTENEYSVLDILRLLVKYIKNDDNYMNYGKFVKDRDFNDFRYSVNSDKLIQLGWKRNIEFNKGLQNTIKWYLEQSK